MHVQKISFYPNRANYSTKNQAVKTNNYMTNSNSQLPLMAYVDYNISFNGRLNRTPANFYEFNKKNLPDTMKDYLEADYEDRRNMPPAQMMKLVYDDINLAHSLEDVSRLYPNEELFANLTDTPNRKAKKGLVSEIEVMKDMAGEAPLFKDGSSNVGMYLLKKIYLEGKQCKEINSDFYKDLADEYKGLITSPVDYSTMSAYGIKFPKTPFWNSFVVTRDDWKYEYKPRKSYERADNAKSFEDIRKSIQNPVESVPKKNKFKVEKGELNRMTDAVIEGHGSSDTAAKHLRRKGIRDEEKTSFVSKYMSQIMSVALEKAHASDEMRDFFENYDSMNKKQREKLDAYWRSHPHMRQIQSLAISDTIKLFFDAFGADGKNPEFQELLAYADSIKPEREREIAKHNQIQAEYDEMFKLLDEAEAPDEVIENPDVSSKNALDEELAAARIKEEAVKNGAEVFSFVSPDGQKYSFVCNVNEVFEKNVRREIELLPTAFQNRYVRFMTSSPLATREYKKSIALGPSLPEFALSEIMSIEDSNKVSTSINAEFGSRYRGVVVANNQALAERILERLHWKPEYSLMLAFDTPQLLDFATNKIGVSNWSQQEKALINDDFKAYTTPIDNKADAARITEMLLDYLSNLDPEAKEPKDALYDDFLSLTAANMRSYPQVRSMVGKIIRQTKFLDSYGGSAKILLKDEVPRSVKDVKCKLMLEDLIGINAQSFIPVWAVSTLNIKRYVQDPSLRSLLHTKSMSMQNKFIS